MGRRKAEETYGLPALSFAEAAKVLGIEEGAFMHWVLKHVRPSSGRWGEWERGDRPLPERFIRLYLSAHAGAGAGQTEEETSPPPRVVAPLRAAPVPRPGRGAGR